MELAAFLNPQQLFDLTPGPWLQYGFFVLVMGFIFLGLGIAAKLVIYFVRIKMPISMVVDRLGSVFVYTGVMTGFFWFCRTQLIPFFSARFWWVLLDISILVWLYFIIKAALSYKKHKEVEMAKRDVYDKYLPKRKQ